MTKHEKYILIFLLTTALLGIGHLHYKNISNQTALPDIIEYKQSGAININTATEQELITLKGIGPVLAARIIEYRRDNGPFLTKQDLKKVSGIGQKKLEEIKDMIKVNEDK